MLDLINYGVAASNDKYPEWYSFPPKKVNWHKYRDGMWSKHPSVSRDYTFMICFAYYTIKRVYK